MKSTRKYMSLFMATTMLVGAVGITFASEEPSVSYADTGSGDDAFMTNELLMEEEGGDWDHETWDEEHQEMVWIALATSAWQSTVPPLKFNGSGTNYVIGEALKWSTSDDKSIYVSKIDSIVNESNCPDEEKDSYKNFIYAIAYVMNAHQMDFGTWFSQDGSDFSVKVFLEGGVTPTGSTTEQKNLNAVEQIARRVMDNRSDADDIYTRDGVKKVLNTIIRSSWTDKFLNWIWQINYSGLHNDNPGLEYEMKGWEGRLDNTDAKMYTGQPNAPVTQRGSSASTSPST